MRVALLGLGLIGGSIARALREDPAGAGPFGGESLEIAAWTPSQIGPRTALAAGSIDFVGRSIAEAVDGAAVVILSAPPIAMAELLDELVVCRRSGRLTDAAVVTDVGSTKRWIMAEASKRGLRFVGGHPMAGSHETGFSAADPNLFLGRPWVVVPGDRSGAGQALVEQLATACGARPVTMDAELHDTATAGISHLPLLLAAALTGSVALGPQASAATGWHVARLLASSGWHSATRLAHGSEEMGADLLATNASEVRVRLRALRDELDAWDSRLAAAERDPLGGRADIRSRLTAVRKALEEEE